MTLEQSFRIYEILGRHFTNNEEAKIVVTEIEQIIDQKINDKKDILATKGDLSKVQEDLSKDIAKVRDDYQHLRADMLKNRIEIEKRFNQLTICIVATGLALAGTTIAAIKL